MFTVTADAAGGATYTHSEFTLSVICSTVSIGLVNMLPVASTV